MFSVKLPLQTKLWALNKTLVSCMDTMTICDGAQNPAFCVLLSYWMSSSDRPVTACSCLRHSWWVVSTIDVFLLKGFSIFLGRKSKEKHAFAILMNRFLHIFPDTTWDWTQTQTKNLHPSWSCCKVGQIWQKNLNCIKPKTYSASMRTQMSWAMISHIVFDLQLIFSGGKKKKSTRGNSLKPSFDLCFDGKTQYKKKQKKTYISLAFIGHVSFAPTFLCKLCFTLRRRGLHWLTNQDQIQNGPIGKTTQSIMHIS